MRRKSRDHLIYRFRQCFAEAAGDGDGGAGGDGGGGDGGEQFDPKASYEEMKGTLASLQKDLGATKKFGSEIASLKKMMGDLNTAIQGLKPQVGNAGDGDDDGQRGDKDDGKDQARQAKNQDSQGDKGKASDANDQAIADLKKQIRELQSQVKKATDETAAERTARIAAEQKQRLLDRDRLILEAAQPLLAEDVTAKEVIRFFKDDMVFDEDEDVWMFTDGGDKLSVEDAIKKHLPKRMQKPKIKQGGSGGTSTGAGNGATKAQLRQNALNLKEQAQKDPRLLSKYNAAKKAYVEAGGAVTDIIDAVAASA